MPTKSPTDRADRTAETIAMLADRLPDVEPSTSFAEFWASVSHLTGILGRNDLYRLLAELDHWHLPDAGLLVRIERRSRTSRQVVLLRPLRSWAEQRAYLRRYVASGRMHPPRPVSYTAAHARVAAERGPASAHVCGECGERAAEWSYAGFSPDEQIGWAGEGGTELRIWSPTPADYDALCRECHWQRDESGAIWPDAPSRAVEPDRRRRVSPAEVAAVVRDVAALHGDTSHAARDALAAALVDLGAPSPATPRALAVAWRAMLVEGETAVGLPADAPAWLASELGPDPVNPRLGALVFSASR